MSDDNHLSENPYQSPNSNSGQKDNVVPLELPFELEGIATVEDQQALKAFAHNRLKNFLIVYAMIGAFFGVVFLALGMILWIESELQETVNDVFPLLLLFPLIFILPAYLFSRPSSSGEEDRDEAVRYSFTKEGIRLTLLENQLEYFSDWGQYKKFVSTQEHFFIKTTIQMFVLPKHFFDSEQQQDAFSAMLLEHIPEQAIDPIFLYEAFDPDSIESNADNVRASGKPTSREIFGRNPNFFLEDYLLLGLSIGTFIACFYYLYINENLPSESSRAFAWIFGLIGFVFLFLQFWSHRINRNFEKSVPPILYVFREENIQIYDPTTSNTLEWEEILNLQAFPYTLKIQTKDRVFRCIPRRFFQSEEDYQSVIELIKRKTSQLQEE